jgi:hypothetical protein
VDRGDVITVRLIMLSGAREIVRLDDAGVVVYAPDALTWAMWARWTDVRWQLADRGIVVESEERK